MMRLTTPLMTAGGLTSLVTALVYLHFSRSVMPGLAKLPAAQGIARMQEFNRTAVKPPFMVAFFGAAVVGIWFAVAWLRGNRTLADTLAAGGGLAYLAGFALTIAFHVPRNEALAALDPTGSASAQVWHTYLREWTGGNTVRAVFSTVAVAAFAAGILARQLSDAH
ncbi:MAG: anthrone oxygenase family protein [Nakamurella sp.]